LASRSARSLSFCSLRLLTCAGKGSERAARAAGAGSS
jgi:hypothetical protein